MNNLSSIKAAPILLSSVSKVYHDGERELEVIKDLSIEFPAGKSIAIVGRSGSGKTTLLHMLAALIPVSTGKIEIGSDDITKMNSEQKARFRGEKLGFVFQFHHLLPEFDALENVCMPLFVGGMNESAARQKAAAILHRVGLADRLKHRPSELSGGEQQRVALARALVTEPAILLADEPTGNLDPHSAEQVKILLLELVKERAVSLIIVTHNLELAGSMDLVYEMSDNGNLKSINLKQL